MSRLSRLLVVLALVVGLLLISLSVGAARRAPFVEVPDDPGSSVRLSSLPVGPRVREIITGPLDFGNGLTLDFAPGAEGWVTATLTTSAPAYAVTATFDYRAEGFIGRSEGADVVLVVDRSASMEDNTLCYGCWTPGDEAYPEGHYHPLPWDADLNGSADHCEGSSPVEYGGEQYVVIEAEEYSASTPSYFRAMSQPGKTYWVIQRNGGRNLGDYGIPSYLFNGDGAGSLGRDALGGYIAHMPSRTFLAGDGMGVPCVFTDVVNEGVCSTHPQIILWGGPYPAPRVDYEFYAPDSGTWYVWFRGQGGDGKNFIWGIDGSPIGEVASQHSSSFENLARSDRWSWQRAGSYSFQAGGLHTIYFWGDDPGTALDRIVLTTDPRDPESFFDGQANNDQYPSSAYEELVNDILNGPAAEVADNNRTDWACDPCDARFGGSPEPAGGEPLCTAAMAHPISPYRYLDDIYDDEQWMRGTVEAFKEYARGFDPSRDQIGVVTFNNTASVVSDLQCIDRLGAGCTTQEITDTVISSLEGLHAQGEGTNLAHGLLVGMEVLSTNSGHYGREEAAKVLILFSDGIPDTTDALPPICFAEDLWPDNTGDLTVDRAKDCAVYYALQARERGIVLFAITQGYKADVDLMQHLAELTGGVFAHSPESEQLHAIFEAIGDDISRLRPRGSLGIYHREGESEPWRLYPLALTDQLGYQVTGRGITELSQWTLGPVSATIVVTASPTLLPADGVATSTVDVQLFGEDLAEAVVTFTTSLGTLEPVTTTAVAGRAAAILTAGLEPGTAVITATAGTVGKTVAVILQPLTPATMTLAVAPDTLPADGTSTAVVTATLTDMYGAPLLTPEVVTFTTSLGTLAPLIATTVGGQVTATLTAGTEPGTTTVTAQAAGLADTALVEFRATLFLPLVLRE